MTMNVIDSYGYATSPLTFARIVNAAGTDIGFYVHVDSSGNSYLCGQYTSTTPQILATSNSNVSTVVATLPATSGSSTDGFCSKFDSDGNYQYSILMRGTTLNEISYSATTDSSNNLYVIGTPAGQSNIAIVSNSNVTTTLSNIFVNTTNYVACASKFSSTGTYLYSLVVYTQGGSDVYGLGGTCDLDGNLYLCGLINSAIANISYFSNTNVQTVVGSFSGSVSSFASKFNSNGTYQGSCTITGASNAVRLQRAASDSDKNVYFGGYIEGSSTSIRNVYSSSVPIGTPFSPGFRFQLQDTTSGSYLGLSGTQVVPVTLANAITWQIKNDSDVYNNSLGGVALQAVAGTNFNSNYMRHAVYVIYADAFEANNLDFGWRFDLVSGNDTFVIYNWLTEGWYLDWSSANSRYEITQNATPRRFKAIPVYVSTTVGSFSSLNQSGIVCKFNPSLQYQYSVAFSGNGNVSTPTVQVTALDCDSLKNVYVGGIHAVNGNTLIRYISPSNVATTVGLISGTSNSTTNGFATKFNSAGTYQYSVTVNTAGPNEAIQGINCDSFDNVYFAGVARNVSANISFVSNSNVISNVATLPALAGAFSSKINTSGTYQYSLGVVGTNSDSIGYSVSTDYYGNMYLGGQYQYGAQSNIYLINSSNVISNLGTFSNISTYSAFMIKANANGIY